MNCPLCKSRLTQNKDAWFYLCGTCHALIKDPQFHLSPAEEKCRYLEHNNNVNDPRYQAFTMPVTQTVLKRYSPHHLGLDYGCGTGAVIYHMLQKKQYRLRRYDPFFYPDENYSKFRYDYIFSCEVFEHFFEPAREIRKLLRLLKADGRIIIMTHLYHHAIPFRNWYYRNDPTHVFIYQKETFEYIAHAWPLEIEEMDDRLIVLRRRPAEGRLAQHA